MTQPEEPSVTELTAEKQKKFERKMLRDLVLGFLIILACIGLLSVLPDSWRNPITVAVVALFAAALVGFIVLKTGD